MRMSDWSSDVCSSDLVRGAVQDHRSARAGLRHRPLGGGGLAVFQDAAEREGGGGEVRSVAAGGGPALPHAFQAADRRIHVADEVQPAGAELRGQRAALRAIGGRKSKRLNSSKQCASRMTSSA